MNCPLCDANDTARCVMVYSQGTFTGSSSASGSSYQSGYGYSPTHAYGHASGSSALAQVVAPPTRPRLKDTGCLVIVGSVVFAIATFLLVRELGRLLGASEDSATTWAVGLMFLPGLLLIPYGLFSYVVNRLHYSRLIKEWAATWICLRCGHRWIPEG
jgi:hypothetical protein